MILNFKGAVHLSRSQLVFDLTNSVSEQNEQLCIFRHTAKLATHPTIKR